MTCIVGYQTDDDVIIGGDSAGVAYYSITSRSDEKVFKNGPFLMGFTSSFRMGNLLRYSLIIPERRNEDIVAFMNTKFIDAVRKCLKDGGYTPSSNSGDRGGTFLVGFEKQLFKVEGDFQVAISRENFDSVGCGEQFALGALFNMKDSNLSAREKVTKALDAANALSAGVCEPYTILSLKRQL